MRAKSVSDRILEDVRTMLRREYAPGDRFLSDRGLARSYGVSLATAHKILSVLTCDGLLERRVGAGTFVRRTPDEVDSTDTGTIAYLVGGWDHTDPYYGRLLAGIEEEASRRGMPVVCSFVKKIEDDALIRAGKQLLGRDDVRAILVAGDVTCSAANRLRDCLAGSQRLILLTTPLGGVVHDFTSVLDCNEQAVRIGFEYLLDKGHRRFAFLNGPQHFPWNRKMAREFWRLVKYHNLQLPGKLVCDDLPEDSVEGGRDATEALLPVLAAEKATAILCVTDRLARGAMGVLRRAGLRIPQDISVMGKGNLAYSAEMEPPLTTVDQCMIDKGREAVRAAAGEYPPGALVKIAARLIERASVRSVGEDGTASTAKAT